MLSSVSVLEEPPPLGRLDALCCTLIKVLHKAGQEHTLMGRLVLLGTEALELGRIISGKVYVVLWS